MRGLGPYVHLWGIDPSQYPTPTASGDDLKPFLTSLLNEALPFIEEVPLDSSDSCGNAPWKHTATKKLKQTDAPVQLYERTIPAEAMQAVADAHKDRLPHVKSGGSGVPSEFWALRRSVHKDAAEPGAATWAEWVRHFKEEHAESEKEFTPTVLGTRLLRQWDCGGITIPYSGGSAGGEDAGGEMVWTDWTLRLEESTHELPAPLKKRVFPVLQATAAVRGRREFLVVQIATTMQGSTGGDGAADVEGEKGSSGQAVQGAYSSVERVREVEQGHHEWIMGTTSDAKGVLPGWVQRVAVPGQVAKDVDFFLGWIAEQREK